MRRSITLAAAAVMALAAVGCAPNPIIARDPVPAPSPDVAFDCATQGLVFDIQVSQCRPAPTAPVVRARG